MGAPRKSVPWQLQDAKNRFSEVVNEAERSGPKIVTRRGAKAAVVLSYKDYRKLSARGRGAGLIDALLSAPKIRGGLKFERRRDVGRKVDWVSYLVDTCVISEQTKRRPAPKVIAWLKAVDAESIFVSVLTLGEIENGIERLAASARRRELRQWYERIRAEAEDRIIAVDEAVASRVGAATGRLPRNG